MKPIKRCLVREDDWFSYHAQSNHGDWGAISPQGGTKKPSPGSSFGISWLADVLICLQFKCLHFVVTGLYNLYVYYIIYTNNCCWHFSLCICFCCCVFLFFCQFFHNQNTNIKLVWKNQIYWRRFGCRLYSRTRHHVYRTLRVSWRHEVCCWCFTAIVNLPLNVPTPQEK